MPILPEDVKLMASQRLTDNEDGGGRMTGVEIVDGNVNNLFPDISRLDRVYGRVSLRKAFVSVQTDNTDTYSGAHVILSLPAKDPNVSVVLFSTGDPNDERAEARDRVESYVTLGPRYQGWLWGDQPAGSRSLLVFQIKGTPLPDIGSVLCLFKDKGLSTEEYQYVRVTKVEATLSEFTSLSDSTYGASALNFKRDILTIEIGDPLRITVPGIEITQNDALATNLYTTIVSDAAKYYGVMLPTQAIEAGDIEINVDSIYTHLVPSAQGESPMVDLSVGEAGPVCGIGAGYSLTATAFSVASGAQLHFGRGIMPNTLSIVSSNYGHTYTDDGNGIMLEGTTQVGTVDYSTGTITFVSVTNYTANLSISATVGVEIPRVPNTLYNNIELSNRGYNYTAILSPLPVPGSVLVDFMAQGKWYRLRDDGSGTLVPDIPNTGTGTVNYLTGSIIVTCGALPDVGTAIIYNWSNPTELFDLSGDVEIDVPEISHTLLHRPINPGSFTMTWPIAASGTATATANAAGVISGDATGWINYASGEINFKPTVLPVAGGEYTIDYDKYPFVQGQGGALGTGICTFTLPNTPVRPGSVSFNLLVTFAGYQHNYAVTDNGQGGLGSAGWVKDLPVSHPTWPGSTRASGIPGTIDYVTGICVFDLTQMQAIESFKEPFVYQICTGGGGTVSPKAADSPTAARPAATLPVISFGFPPIAGLGGMGSVTGGDIF